mmetsp:Transcript_62893/g.74405  ORF Transcript_62893/g.74405 Transcript_62893/m.74405 type:complete len:122 (-) Transcript_62893:391-756(-)
MYPSVKISKIKRAIEYFTTSLSAHDKETISICVDLIEFGMLNTLITFQGNYMEYNGGEDDKEKVLAIGGYKSAFLSDLVASYLFEIANQNRLFDGAKVTGIYQDDGINVTKEPWSVERITT